MSCIGRSLENRREESSNPLPKTKTKDSNGIKSPDYHKEIELVCLLKKVLWPQGDIYPKEVSRGW